MQGGCLLKAPRPRDAGDAPPSLICRHCPGNAARVYPRVARAQINFVELVAPAPPQGSSIEKTRETLTDPTLRRRKISTPASPRHSAPPVGATGTSKNKTAGSRHRNPATSQLPPLPPIGPSSSTVASSFVNNHFPSTIETSIATETNRPPGSDTDTSIFGTDGTAQLSHRGVCRVTRTPSTTGLPLTNDTRVARQSPRFCLLSSPPTLP